MESKTEFKYKINNIWDFIASNWHNIPSYWFPYIHDREEVKTKLFIA